MNKQHFAGFLTALIVTAAQFYAIEAVSSSTPLDRGNPAVAEETVDGSRVAGPAATPAQLRRFAA